MKPDHHTLMRQRRAAIVVGNLIAAGAVIFIFILI